ncbi:MAG TPA: hypothetical protein DEB37_15180 [Lysinibacillus sp.]|uniref:hypothetical protein n=1 Tax=Lysinibacillus TaxID=400634 RepID=UPI000738A62D|nr:MULTISPECIES: hypothetical protein [unclassified Lysinibacillus]KUF37350.1 hypothetical protein AK833_00215 [Lysinibacillus sp. F5]MEE3809606.1 hypothetical protein [Lysinibacillus fusiformis]HBT73534.1 hypothetical protein [Lysinibacillus sp.]
MQKPKGADTVITFFDNLKELALLVILIASMVYRRQLKLTKWQRTLTIGEWTMYIMLSIALPLYAVLYIAFILGT